MRSLQHSSHPQIERQSLTYKFMYKEWGWLLKWGDDGGGGAGLLLWLIKYYPTKTRLDSTRLARERENVVVAVVVCRRRAHLMMRGSVVFPSTTTTRIYAKGHVCVCVCVFLFFFFFYICRYFYSSWNITVDCSLVSFFFFFSGAGCGAVTTNDDDASSMCTLYKRR